MRQIMIEVPAMLELSCPLCKANYSIESNRLAQVADIYCPICGARSSLYESMAGEVRRRIYHAVRDELEHRIYEQQQMDSGDYFEDRANLG